MPRFLAIAALAVAMTLPVTSSADSQTRRSSRDAKKSRKDKPTITHRSRVAGGRHWRIKTKTGPIHVWVPPGYRRASAGTVVYVHGYGTPVDYAWKHHNLPQQFRKSRQNAIFIAPEAPVGKADYVRFKELGKLKHAVLRAGIRLPNGPAIAIGHSGAIRTLSQWVDNRLLAEVILLDANYGRERELSEFIHNGKRARHHKMILIGNDTAARAKRFTNKFKYAVLREKIPDSYRKFTRREKGAKLLYIRSQYGHMPMVTNGKVIPLILRLTPLKRL
jgi:hypothetical protein